MSGLIFGGIIESIPMQYGQFEEALVRMFSIKEANMGAFRARLRHLRRLGIPNIPKQGSGNTAIYKPKDLVITFVALALQTLGSAPTISAQIAKFSARYFEKLRSREEDTFLVVMHTSEARSEFVGWLIKSAPTVERASLTMNPFGGDTYAFFVLGAAEAGRFVTGPKAVASSVINLSEHFKARPKEP
jgi:hypothetical protein